MSEISELVQSFQKKTQQQSNHIQTIVETELKTLESFTKKRVQQSQNLISNALADSDNKNRQKIESMAQKIDSMESKMLSIFSLGLAAGVVISMTLMFFILKIKGWF